jgi:Secretion system C-terminal sorting domain
MKTTLQFLFISLIGIAAKAQSFSISNPILSNTNATFSGFIESKATIKNLTNSTLYLEWTRTNDAIPSTWEAQVCTDQCSTPATNKRGFTLLPKQEREIKVVFYPRKTSGNGTIELTINTYDNSEAPIVTTFVGAANGLFLVSPVSAASSTKKTINVFPNPVTTYFQLEENDVVKNIEVYNSVGRKVFDFHVTQDDEKFNIVNLPAGMYYLRMMSSSGEIVHTARITKVSP